MTRLDLSTLEREVASLLAAYPDLSEDEDLRADMLEGSTEVFDVLARLVDRLQHATAMREAVSARIATLTERRDRFGRQQEALRTVIQRVMSIADLRKAELAEATLSVRPGTPKVVVTDESELPEWFVRVKREPDKTAIKQALKDGQFVPGATLSNAEEVLNVRVA